MPTNFVLDEPFDDLSDWSTQSGSPTITAGRTGSALDMVVAPATAVQYVFADPDEDRQVVVGFAMFSTAIDGGTP